MFRYLREITQGDGKEVEYIIFGAGATGENISNALRCIGVIPSCFIDSDENKWGKKLRDIRITGPQYLQEKSGYKIIIASGSYREIGFELEKLGLKRNKDFYDLNGLGQHKRCDIFDPLLGYARMDDIEGFKIHGNPKAEKRIVILGNSVSDYSSSNIKAWPEFFYEIYGKNKDIAVYNGAISGYFSSQELFKLLRDGIKIDPDIVITLTGINEAAAKKRAEDTTFYSTYLIHQIEKNIPINKKLGLGLEDKRCPSAIWYDNMKMMEAICNLKGSAFFCFLQPSLHYGKYLMSQMEKQLLDMTYTKEQNEAYTEFFEEAVSFIKNEKRMYDFTMVFEDMEGILYDHCHPDERGNQRLAEKIAEIVEKEG